MTKNLSKQIETLLWDVDYSAANDNSIILFERILNYGDVDEVRWLFENFDSEEIANFIKTMGQKRLNKKSLIFWSGYFETGNILGDITRESEVAFGQGRWL